MNYQLIKIGRSGDNDVKFAHASVSRHHAEIFVDADGNVFVRDLNSSNGTFVNDVKIEGGKELKSGDVVRVGVEDIVEWQKMVQPAAGVARKITGDQSSVQGFKPQRKQIALILSFCVIVFAGIAFFVYRSAFSPPDITLPKLPIPQTDEPQKKEVTIHTLENASLEELNDLKLAIVTDFQGDTTLNSKREKARQLVIKKGVFTMHMEKIEGGRGEKEKSGGKKDNTEKSSKKAESTDNEKKKSETKDKREDSKKTTDGNKQQLKSGDTETYITKADDTLPKIAQLYKGKGCNVTADQIANDNSGVLNNSDVIKAGQLLKIKCR
jgi:pSer/pThr/pTyr-binding forkhead associated (FHA) protein